MGFIKRIGSQKRETTVRSARTAPKDDNTVLSFFQSGKADLRLYDCLREAVPVIDAAISLSARLCGGFDLVGENDETTQRLDRLKNSVRVGASGEGMEEFLVRYIDGLLTYGNAVGEIIPTFDEDVCRLYIADVRDLEFKEKNGGAGIDVSVREHGKLRSVKYPELLAFTALNPKGGNAAGTSILRGLPFVSGILLDIFKTVGQNWEKAGNIRYAVTYKPSGDPLDKAYAKERAQSIAEEWGHAMRSRDGGDFVAVGDVSVKVIGAESGMPDSSVPVQQMLEQIVAKMGVPPFVLGLNWSSTERMSSEQADIFTRLLSSYRRAVEPAIRKIGETYLRLSGKSGSVRVKWRDINLREALSEAQAEYYRARAAALPAAETNTHGGDDIYDL